MGSLLQPSAVAVETKRGFMPYIAKWIKYPTSHFYPAAPAIGLDKRFKQRLRVAVVKGDPVNYALGYFQYETEQFHDASMNPSSQSQVKMPVKMPVVNMANEVRVGGDWESNLIAPEECFARRSNLVQALTKPYAPEMYPLPPKGGIYTPNVCTY